MKPDTAKTAIATNTFINKDFLFMLCSLFLFDFLTSLLSTFALAGTDYILVRLQRQPHAVSTKHPHHTQPNL
jgi:hypothetical protein